MARKRKSFNTILTHPCEQCGTEMNLHLVSTIPPGTWQGTCQGCGQAQRVPRARREPKVIGYLRVSTDGQDLEKNKADILSFANGKRIAPVEWVEEKVSGVKDWQKRELGKALNTLNEGDWLITPELSRLGRSTLGILEVLAELKRRGVNVHALKGAWTLNSTIEAKVFLTMMALFSEIERDLISARTKEALKARRVAGVKLGRPKGPGKSKLDPYRPEIEALLRTGSTLKYIARRYGSSEANLLNWLKKNDITRAPDYGA